MRLESCPRLSTLCLNDNWLKDEGAALVLSALGRSGHMTLSSAEPHALTSLDLARNKLGVGACRLLVDVAAVCTRLSTLCLRDNLLDAECAPLLAEVLRRASSLTVLDLSSNLLCIALSPEAVRAACASEKDAALLTTALGARFAGRLPSGTWHTEGFDALVKALCQHASLTHVSLANGRLCGVYTEYLDGEWASFETYQSAALELLIKALGASQRKTPSPLSIDLNGNRASAELLEIVKRAVHEHAAQQHAGDATPPIEDTPRDGSSQPAVRDDRSSSGEIDGDRGEDRPATPPSGAIVRAGTPPPLPSDLTPVSDADELSAGGTEPPAPGAGSSPPMPTLALSNEGEPAAAAAARAPLEP